MPATWKVNLRNFAGDILTDRGHLSPMQLNWSKNLNASGGVSCGFSLRDERYVTHDWISPYAQDWELLINDGITYTDDVFMEGVVTSHEIDDENELSMFGGQDYMHLFERRGYPFDPDHPGITQGGVRLLWTLQDTSLIVKDIIQTVLAQNNTFFVPTLNIPTMGFSQGFRLMPGDSSSLVNIIESFAQGYPGFDFGFTTDPTTFHTYNLEYDQYHTPIYEFRESNDDGSIPGLSQLKWSNSGPQGTHAAGIGAGTSTQWFKNRGYLPAQVIYRRMDIYPSFGDIINETQVERETAGALGLALAPVYELSFTVDPDFITTTNGFFRDFVPGAYFFIRKDIKGHLLDGLYKIVQMSGAVSDEGQCLVQIGANRETDLSLNFSDTTP